MNTTQQLTIRGVDEATKNTLIARARQRGMSLNAYNLELLRQDAGTTDAAGKTNGLERFIGIAPLDPQVEETLRDQHKATPDKWDSYGL
jgi:plasmid stability protein